MAVYNSTDVFALFSDAAVGVIYKRGKKRFDVRGILDSPYQGVNVAEVEFASDRITLTLPTAALPTGAAEGDVIIQDCNAYIVREMHPDGTGVTVLVLEETTDLEEPT